MISPKSLTAPPAGVPEAVKPGESASVTPVQPGSPTSAQPGGLSPQASTPAVSGVDSKAQGLAVSTKQAQVEGPSQAQKAERRTDDFGSAAAASGVAVGPQGPVEDFQTLQHFARKASAVSGVSDLKDKLDRWEKLAPKAALVGQALRQGDYKFGHMANKAIVDSLHFETVEFPGSAPQPANERLIKEVRKAFQKALDKGTESLVRGPGFTLMEDSVTTALGPKYGNMKLTGVTWMNRELGVGTGDLAKLTTLKKKLVTKKTITGAALAAEQAMTSVKTGPMVFVRENRDLAAMRKAIADFGLDTPEFKYFKGPDPAKIFQVINDPEVVKFFSAMAEEDRSALTKALFRGDEGGIVKVLSKVSGKLPDTELTKLFEAIKPLGLGRPYLVKASKILGGIADVTVQGVRLTLKLVPLLNWASVGIDAVRLRDTHDDPTSSEAKKRWAALALGTGTLAAIMGHFIWIPCWYTLPMAGISILANHLRDTSKPVAASA